ncbi:BTB/POZ domain-containing protein [Acorus gramineus]|uniref:BTB/POZ domain-containing protein n=1 Tax=Acorus gramineus TaxID=55184 RepID=A0AAV9BVK3_ACOGR|nr:BTB/POZ domain-containing protein [Acorus gramineus]
MVCMKLGSKSDGFHRQGQACGVLEKLIGEASGDEIEEGCVIRLPDLPGGAKAFELVAKFCYGVKLELTATNVVHARCVAEHLQMTEEYFEGNLVAQTEAFLTQVVFRSWKDSIVALQACEDLLPHAEDLHIVKRCIESLAAKACTDPNLFGWPMMEHGSMQSPGGSVLWNGISTGARPRNSSPDWWYEDVSSLSLPIYKRLVSVMESRSVKREIIAGSIVFYAKRYLPGLARRHGSSGEQQPVNRLAVPLPSTSAPPSEEEQKLLLEEIDKLLPMQKAVAPTKFLFGLLRTALILRASPSCIANLERRAHPWMSDVDRELLCRLMDCQKLSLEACTHAAQNERLPLRVVVQVLFFEQLQLRTSIAGCFLVSDNLDGGSRPLRGGLVGSADGGGNGGGWATAVRENQVLKVGMDHMRMRVSELERECSSMRLEIEKLGHGKKAGNGGGGGGWGRKLGLGFRAKSQMCSAQEDSVSDGHRKDALGKAMEKLQLGKQAKHKKNLSLEE